jgi:hypothetical protein
MNVTPDPVLIASEGALWGAIHPQGLLPDTAIVSDDAGQFRVGAHALCWIDAERLVHKLVPANDKQRNAVEIVKRMIWWVYRALKDDKLAPGVEQAQLLRQVSSVSSSAPARDTPRSIGCSGGCFATRRGSCAPRSSRNP